MKTDLPLKRIIQRRPADLLPLFGIPDAAVLGVETLELPASSTRLDSLLRLRGADGQAYLHLVEWQGYRDETVLWRLMGYLAWLGQHRAERPILTTLVYVHPDADVGDTIAQAAAAGGWQLALSVVRLWEHDAASTLADGTPGMLALLPLLGGATAPMVETAARAIIAQVAGQTQGDLLVALGVFAEPLISAGHFLQMVTKERLMTSDLISLLTQEAIEEGRAEGQRELVGRQLQRKLGPLSETLRTRVSTLSGDALDALADALLDFTSQDDLSRWLDAQ